MAGVLPSDDDLVYGMVDDLEDAIGEIVAGFDLLRLHKRQADDVFGAAVRAIRHACTQLEWEWSRRRDERVNARRE